MPQRPLKFMSLPRKYLFMYFAFPHTVAHLCINIDGLYVLVVSQMPSSCFRGSGLVWLTLMVELVININNVFVYYVLCTLGYKEILKWYIYCFFEWNIYVHKIALLSYMIYINEVSWNKRCTKISITLKNYLNTKNTKNIWILVKT